MDTEQGIQMYHDGDLQKSFIGEEPQQKIINVWFWTVNLWVTFKKYAQVETKYLPAASKTKGIDTKYINESKSNITKNSYF